MVDTLDLDVWRAEFGRSNVIAAAIIATPEPAAVGLLGGVPSGSHATATSSITRPDADCLRDDGTAIRLLGELAQQGSIPERSFAWCLVTGKEPKATEAQSSRLLSLHGY